MRHWARFLLLAALALLALPALRGAPLQAQEPGDFYWQLAPEGLLADQRVEQALVMMADPQEVAAKAGVDGALFYGNTLQGVFDETRSDEISILFAAAGIETANLIEQQRCLFWTPDGDGSVERQAVGAAIGEALAAGFDTHLHLAIQPCAYTSDFANADYLVWQFGADIEGPVGEFDPAGGSSFLGYVLPETSPAEPAGVANMSPPSGGDGGLLNAGSDQEHSLLPAVVLTALALLFVWRLSATRTR